MAIEDLIVSAVGDAALVAATLVLANVTRALYKETNVLAQIEKKRDLRQTLSERIEIGEALAAVQPGLITEYLGGASRHAPVVLEAAAQVRRLRTLLLEGGDTNLSSLKFSLDHIMMNMDNADGGATDMSGVEKEIGKHVENVKSKLRIAFLPQWRKELQTLYGE